MRKAFFAAAATVLTLGYLLPFAVAYYRGHRNQTAIGMVNIFAGWTLVGWVIAIVWAAAQAPEIIALRSQMQASAARLPCPHCAEAILPLARVCHYCGHALPAAWAAGAEIVSLPRRAS